MDLPIANAIASTDPKAGTSLSDRPGLSGLSPEAIAAWLAERGEPSYRARQIADAVFGGRVGSIEEIATLPGGLRRDLSAAFRFDTLAETDLRVSDEGLTEKALHRLADGALIELPFGLPAAMHFWFVPLTDLLDEAFSARFRWTRETTSPHQLIDEDLPIA